MSLKYLFFLIAIIYCQNSTDLQYPMDQGIYLLNETNFHPFLKTHDNIVVLFYVDWSTDSNEFEPIYTKAAAILKDENITLAKVDSMINLNLSKEYNIQVYPGIRYFRKNMTYNLNNVMKNLDEFILWVRKKNEITLKLLNTEREIEEFKIKSVACVIFYGTDQEKFKSYNNISTIFADIKFGYVNNIELIKKLQIEENIAIIYKIYPNTQLITKNMTVVTLYAYLRSNAIYPVETLNKRSASHVFLSYNVGVFLFRPTSEENSTFCQDFIELSSEYINKYQFIMSGTEHDIEMQLIELLGIKKYSKSSLVLVDPTGDYFKKYIMEEPITKESIRKFIEDWENKKLKPFWKSLDPPEVQDKDLFILVGKTYNKYVMDNTKDVVVLYVAIDCMGCLPMDDAVSDMAKKFKGNENILFTKIYMEDNEVEGLTVDYYPSIKIYPKNKKDQPVDFRGKESYDNILKFIKDNCSFDFNVEDYKRDEKKEDKKDDKKDEKKEEKKEEKKDEKKDDTEKKTDL